MMASVLFIEPFFGGSHRAFAEGYARHSAHDVTLLTLPGRNWKWRMRGGAPAIAARAHASDDPAVARPDAIVVTSLANLAELRGLGPAAWRDTPALLYFHENQLTYPIRGGGERRDLHFAMTHAISMLAADAVAFNSAYQRREFGAALPGFLQSLPDTKPREVVKLAKEALVLPPGIDEIERGTNAKDGGTNADESVADVGDGPTILWNHRWEYDKGPDRLLAIVRALRAKNARFRLLVTGAGHDEREDVFSELPDAAGPHLAHVGFVETRDDYEGLLRRADIVLSTARHEFFGIAVLEAVLAGAFPLLPEGLSYPELIDPSRFPECYYRREDELLARLCALLEGPHEPPAGLREAIAHHVWPEPARVLDRTISDLVRGKESVR